MMLMFWSLITGRRADVLIAKSTFVLLIWFGITRRTKQNGQYRREFSFILASIVLKPSFQ